MTCVQTALFFDALAGTVGRPVTANDVEEVTLAVIERGRSETALRYAADVERIRRLGRDISIGSDEFDVFVTPTLTHPPRPLGHLRMSEPDLALQFDVRGDAAFMYPFNISGQPAISLPLHWSAEGLPIGVQFVGRTATRDCCWRSRRFGGGASLARPAATVHGECGSTTNLTCR